MIRKVNLCDHNDCTGCMVCAGVCTKKAISIQIDDEGFSHPIIDDNVCVGCNMCVKTCPVLSPIDKYEKGDVYAAWSESDNIRLKSSSGGIFSELAIAILKMGGIVVGASMDSEGYVFHQIVDCEENLNKLRGSKYVQSNILPDLYSQIKLCLQNKRKVLFTGTPCQVAGARKIFRDDENLFTMDLVCHGVPSPEFFAKIYKGVKNMYPNIVGYNFRKLDSWAVCSSVNVNVNGKIINRPLFGKYTLYQDAFLKGYLHRPNCYNCPYSSIERVGDITVADFWGIGKYKPIAEDYRKGCSMVSVNSFKGQKLFNLIQNRIFFENRDIQETIEGGNEQLIKSADKPIGRESFYRNAFAIEEKEIIRKYNLQIKENPTFFNRVKRKIKKFINN